MLEIDFRRGRSIITMLLPHPSCYAQNSSAPSRLDAGYLAHRLPYWWSAYLWRLDECTSCYNRPWCCECNNRSIVKSTYVSTQSSHILTHKFPHIRTHGVGGWLFSEELLSRHLLIWTSLCSRPQYYSVGVQVNIWDEEITTGSNLS